MCWKSALILLAMIAVANACGSSGSCGCCGCRAKAKARAAVTRLHGEKEFDDRDDGNIFGLEIWNATELTIEKERDNMERLTNPNFLFHRCCEQRRLPDACVQLCHFNTYDGAALKSIFVGTHKCPMEFVAEMQFCAAQGRDHRPCCVKRGVHQTLAQGKCLTFCDQRPDIYTPIDYSYSPCYDRFEDMKRCFYEDVRSSAERKFSPMIEGLKTMEDHPRLEDKNAHQLQPFRTLY